MADKEKPSGGLKRFAASMMDGLSEDAIAQEMAKQEQASEGQTRSPHAPPAMQRESILKDICRARDEAQARVAEMEGERKGATLVRAIDPKRTRHSRFANREVEAIRSDDVAFNELVASIVSMGRNSVPIIVRKVSDDPNFDYEIAVGHRRHAAVLQALRDVETAVSDIAPELHAEIRELSDAELLLLMWKENREREDLSAWETARTVGMIEGTIKMSERELAQKTGLSKTVVRRCRQLMAMPVAVLDAFGPDRRNVPARLPDVLADALRDDQAGVLSRAKKLADLQASGTHVSPANVLRRLLSDGTSTSTPEAVKVSAHKGRSVTFELPSELSSEQIQAMAAAMAAWVDKHAVKPEAEKS